jgi:hypothetical protein
LSDINNDGSAQARKEIFALKTNQALTSFVGQGIGITETVDSAILDLPLSLGWVGCIFYISGFFSLISLVVNTNYSSDQLLNTSKSIIVGFCFQLLFGSVMLSLSGVTFWFFLGVIAASRKYHEQPLNKLEFIQQIS